jgi:hypothetical protein
LQEFHDKSDKIIVSQSEERKDNKMTEKNPAFSEIQADNLKNERRVSLMVPLGPSDTMSQLSINKLLLH